MAHTTPTTATVELDVVLRSKSGATEQIVGTITVPVTFVDGGPQLRPIDVEAALGLLATPSRRTRSGRRKAGRR